MSLSFHILQIFQLVHTLPTSSQVILPNVGLEHNEVKSLILLNSAHTFTANVNSDTDYGGIFHQNKLLTELSFLSMFLLLCLVNTAKISPLSLSFKSAYCSAFFVLLLMVFMMGFIGYTNIRDCYMACVLALHIVAFVRHLYLTPPYSDVLAL